MFEALEVLDGIRLNFTPGGLFVLNLTLAFIMFGVALEIKVEHFKNVWEHKRNPIIGFLSQFVALPFVTFLLVIALNRFITPTIAMGMILVAACPGGNISNFMTALAKGHVALSVTLTAIATIAAIVMTPLNFLVWGGLYTKYISIINADSLLRPIKIDPVEVFTTVFIILGIPLILGMLFNHFFTKITAKMIKPFRIFAIAAFAGILVISFKNNLEYFVKYIKYIFIIVLIHNALGFLTGYLFSWANKCNHAVRRTITIETGIQNSGLALVLLFNPRIFPMEIHNGGMAFIAAWWGIWHIIAGLTLSFIWSRKAPANFMANP